MDAKLTPCQLKPLQAQVVVESTVHDSPRLQQVRGIFDLASSATSRLEWNVALPLAVKRWHVGLIVGPSGCGKSTIACQLWREEMQAIERLSWLADASILDGFRKTMPVSDVVALLSSVGFASPPAWLHLFRVQSTGQQFRVALARLLAEHRGLVVFDEYTSVVDRTVAQVGSHALQKTVRARGQQFIAVTYHEDVEA
jgi:ABC-type lipoprotein export system ATPase subunit